MTQAERAHPRDQGLADIWQSGAAPQPTQAGDFVQSALRAAAAMRTAPRRAVLDDIASVLGCEADALNFMFAKPTLAANDTEPVSVPDFRRHLRHPSAALAVAAAE